MYSPRIDPSATMPKGIVPWPEPVPAPGALNLVILCPAGTCASGNEEAAITNERVANTESTKIRERVMGKFLLRQGLDAFAILKPQERETFGLEAPTGGNCF